jgi:hypothetical protein
MISQFDMVGEFGIQLFKQLFENKAGHFSWLKSGSAWGVTYDHHCHQSLVCAIRSPEVS